MTQRWCGWEGQPSGTTWNAANSGGGSGDALTAQTGGGTATFSSAQAAHGTRSLLINTTANQARSEWTGLSFTNGAIRFYFRLNAAIASAQDIASFVGGPKLQLTATGQLRVIAADNTTNLRTWTAFSLNTWYRIELYAAKGTTTTDGTITAAYYLGDSTTAQETVYSSSATNAGTANYTGFYFGKLTGGSVALNAHFDDVLADDAATGLPGPLTSTVKTESWTWDVLEPLTSLTSSSSWTWNVRSQASKTHAVTWGVRTQASKTHAVNWAVRTQASKTHAVTWAVRSQQSKTHAVTWSVRSQQSKTHAVNWAVRSQQSKTHVLNWAVRTQASKTSAFTWAVRAQQQATASWTWNVIGATIATYPVSWNVAERKTATHASTWAVRTPHTTTAAWTWGVRSQLTKAHALNWAVRSQASRTAAFNWAVRTQASRTYAANWAVRSALTKTTAWNWAVRTQASKTHAVTWAVRSQASKTSAWTWAVRARQTKTHVLNWAVRTRLTRTAAYTWNVSAAVGSRVVLAEVGAALPQSLNSKVILAEVAASVGGSALEVSVTGPDMVEPFSDVQLAAVVTGGLAQSYLWQVISGPSVEPLRADTILEYEAPGARERIAQIWRLTVDGRFTADKTVTTYMAPDFVLTPDGWLASAEWELIEEGLGPTSFTTTTFAAAEEDVQVFSTPGNGTWTKPAGKTTATVYMVGGGSRGYTNADMTGAGLSGTPAQGGYGGAYLVATIPLADLGATEAVYVARGGSNSGNLSGDAEGCTFAGMWVEGGYYGGQTNGKPGAPALAANCDLNGRSGTAYSGGSPGGASLQTGGAAGQPPTPHASAPAGAGGAGGGATGSPGGSYGGGGGGGSTTAGIGANGVVVVVSS